MAATPERPPHVAGTRLGRWLDRQIATVSPGRAVDRARSRAILAVAQSGYPATRSGRGRRIYSGRGGSGDAHLDARTLGQLREQCRALDRQDPIFSGILNRALDNILGPSLNFSPNTADPAFNTAAKRYFQNRATAHTADIRGMSDLADLFRKSLRAVWVDGDHLLGFAGDAIQQIEGDQINTPAAKRGGDSRVLNGVEVNAHGRPVRFWITSRNYGHEKYRTA